MWNVLVHVAVGLVAIWLVMLVALFAVARKGQDSATFREAVRLIPDVIRLVRRLAADPALPRGVRWRLSALLVYLLLPIDLVPDFVPLLGYADDAVVIALALRCVVRVSGPEALDRHWPGTPQGLETVRKLVGV